MGRSLESTRFGRRLDFAKMADSFGLRAVAIEDVRELSPKFFAGLTGSGELPVLVDCRISNEVVGPGLSRYNQVRSLLGKTPISPADMATILGEASVRG